MSTVVIGALLVTANVLASTVGLPPFVEQQIDLATEHNLAGIVGNVLTVGAAVGFFLVARTHRRLISLPSFKSIGWGFLAVTFLTIALVDLLEVSVNFTLTVIIGIVVTGLLLLLVYTERPARQSIKWLFILGIVVLATNPGTEYFELKLASDPSNYTFVAIDQPYQFNADASRRLSTVRRVQEESEIVGMICLLVACWLLCKSEAPPVSASA